MYLSPAYLDGKAVLETPNLRRLDVKLAVGGQTISGETVFHRNRYTASPHRYSLLPQ